MKYRWKSNKYHMELQDNSIMEFHIGPVGMYAIEIHLVTEHVTLFLLPLMIM